MVAGGPGVVGEEIFGVGGGKGRLLGRCLEARYSVALRFVDRPRLRGRGCI